MLSMIPARHAHHPLHPRFGADFDRMFEVMGALQAPSFMEPQGFKMNVEELDDAYEVTALLAGVSRDQIEVELNEGRLSISVECQDTEEDESRNWIHKETASWSASRGVYLKDAASEGLTARLSDGVLSIHVPKQQKSETATKITIE